MLDNSLHSVIGDFFSPRTASSSSITSLISLESVVSFGQVSSLSLCYIFITILFILAMNECFYPATYLSIIYYPHPSINAVPVSTGDMSPSLR